MEMTLSMPRNDQSFPIFPTFFHPFLGFENFRTGISLGRDLARRAHERGRFFGGAAPLFFWGNQFPYAPCMVYLPTFGSFMGQMLVNIPYMEHMGLHSKKPHIMRGMRTIGS